jgi:hypothetical protein
MFELGIRLKRLEKSNETESREVSFFLGGGQQPPIGLGPSHSRGF